MPKPEKKKTIATLYTADWCGPCNRLKAHLDSVFGKAWKDVVKIVDTDKEGAPPRVKGIPYLETPDGQKIDSFNLIKKIKDILKLP